MKKNELEEAHERLCNRIQIKTRALNELNTEVEALHAEAEELEYQIANYEDEDED